MTKFQRDLKVGDSCSIMLNTYKEQAEVTVASDGIVRLILTTSSLVGCTLVRNRSECEPPEQTNYVAVPDKLFRKLI